MTDIETRAFPPERDPRAPEAPTKGETLTDDRVNQLGDLDANAGPSLPQLPDEPTAQSVRRYPDLYDDATKAAFGMEGYAQAEDETSEETGDESETTEDNPDSTGDSSESTSTEGDSGVFHVE